MTELLTCLFVFIVIIIVIALAGDYILNFFDRRKQ